jgi:predicted DNA-binding transcriptional regulator AlpA
VDFKIGNTTVSKGTYMTFINDQFLNIDQVCEILQVSRSQFWKMRKKGWFPSTVNVGDRPRWSAIELKKALKTKPKK